MFPALPHFLYNLLYDVLNLFIGGLCLSTSLRVLGCGYAMLDFLVSEIAPKGFVYEMRASITNDHSRNSKTRKDGFLEHHFGMLSIYCLTGYGFYHFET